MPKPALHIRVENQKKKKEDFNAEKSIKVREERLKRGGMRYPAKGDKR